MKNDEIQRIREIAKAVEEFTGFKVRGSHKKGYTRIYGSGAKESARLRRKLCGRRTLARGMFFKYGLENQIKTRNLASFSSDICRETVKRSRKAYNKTLASSAEEKELYNKFIVYMNELRTSN